MAVPQKVANRIVTGLKRFQPVLAAAKTRDVNESDTVVIVTDMLHEVFGYDKYAEITSEHSIRGTYCDLAIKAADSKPQLLIEAKAIGVELKDAHVKQAIDYAANQGTEWVILTSGMVWRIYKVIFAKPIDQELVLEFDLEKVNPKSEDDIERLWLLTKEGWQRGGIGEFHMQRRALSRFFLGAVVLSTPVAEVVRRELRRLSPGVRISVEEIEAVLRQEVIKRDVLEGEKYEEARKLVSRAAAKSRRTKRERPSGEGEVGGPEPEPADPGDTTASAPGS